MQNKIRVNTLIVTAECSANIIIINNSDRVHSCTKRESYRGQKWWVLPRLSQPVCIHPHLARQEYTKLCTAKSSTGWRLKIMAPPLRGARLDTAGGCSEPTGGGWSSWNLISPAKILGKQRSTKHCQQKELEEHVSGLQGALRQAANI